MKDDPAFRELVKGTEDGVIVDSVLPDGSATKSDLHPSDVITSVDGKAVGTAQQLRDEVRHKLVGQPVTLDVFRGGKVVKVLVKPSEYVDPTVVASARNDLQEAAPSALGVTVHAMTRELAGQFSMDVTEGVIVVAVDKDSPAAHKGIKPGDVITSINQQPVTNPKQFRDALKKADLKKGVIVNLVSGDTARFEILKEGDD